MGKVLFVTGRLAAPSLRHVIESSSIDGDVFVLPIEVAALANTRYIARHLVTDKDYDFIMIPGLSAGETDLIEKKINIKTVKGPRDLLDIPEFFGEKREVKLDKYEIRIFAEINNAPLLTYEEILEKARYYKSCGADVIDIGCSLEKKFDALQRIVSRLKGEGFVLSIDTLTPEEMLMADDAGVDYVLSLNSKTMHIAERLECTPIVIPDEGGDLESLEKNIASLEGMGKRYIIDPLLSPINFGFTESLKRYLETRKRHPTAEMLAGLGNTTELCDADSVGMNTLLCGIMTELDITNLLTTEASHKTQGAIRELDIARRMMFYAKRNNLLPRRITDKLLVVKEEKRNVYTEKELKEMQKSINPRDENLRIFVSDKIYVFNGKLFISGTNKKEIFSRLDIKDAPHAFYLGMELERAELALRLGKKYIQEQELRWGYMGEG